MIFLNFQADFITQVFKPTSKSNLSFDGTALYNFEILSACPKNKELVKKRKNCKCLLCSILMAHLFKLIPNLINPTYFALLHFPN